MVRPHLYIAGCRGIPARYGGFETFVEQLAPRLARDGYPVSVTCEGEKAQSDRWQGVERLLFSAAAKSVTASIVNDRSALKLILARAQRGDKCMLLGYGLGPFGFFLVRKLQKRGVQFWINPDGLEWKRSRWPWYGRLYLRLGERALCGQADRIICDSAAIAAHERHSHPAAQTPVIEYGAPLFDPENAPEGGYSEFLEKYQLRQGQYYLTVGRFVAENNLLLILREYLQSHAQLPLLMVTNPDEGALMRQVETLLQAHPARAGKVHLVGPIYDAPLLARIRYGAYCYLHGHEVGGTNPSLLESMGCRSAVCALDVDFNREVLQEGGLFFSKEEGRLAVLFDKMEAQGDKLLEPLRQANARRIQEYYNWERITALYERLIAGAL